MNGRNVMLAAAAVFALAIPVTLDAQTIYVSAGVTFPSSDYGDATDTGWMGAGGVLFDIGTPGLSIGGEGFYGQNGLKSEFEGDDPKLYGAMAIVDYDFQMDGSITPYVFGGLGLMVLDAGGETESGFGYQVGAGAAYPLSPTVSLYGEGRYMGGSISPEVGDDVTVGLFGVLAGVAFQLGN